MAIYLADDTTSISITEKIFFTLSNICAERDFLERNAVVEQSGIIEFLDKCINNLPVHLAQHLPWLLMNLFINGMSSVMDSEAVVPSCFKVLATALTHLLTLDNMEPESKTWQSAIKYSLEFLKCTFTVPSPFKFNKEQNLELGIQLLPLT